jgi:hypothetical protein
MRCKGPFTVYLLHRCNGIARIVLYHSIPCMFVKDIDFPMIVCKMLEYTSCMAKMYRPD